jgi:hypothetical protein
MQEEIDEEGPVTPVGGDQQQGQAGGDAEPVDNTYEKQDSESLTPELDNSVEKSALNINRK